MFDLIIKNGTVCDGLSDNPIKADIAVKNGRIVKIGKLQECAASKTFFANGLFVLPAMIDAHTHADYLILENPINLSKLYQGVACEICGNCGFSISPYSNEHLAEWQEVSKNVIGGVGAIPWEFPTFAQYIERLEKQPLGQHLGTLVGSGAIRMSIKGMERGRLTAKEREYAAALVEDAIAAGAMGLSSGLIYAPDCYSDTEDLLCMAKGLRKSRAPYVVHMRGEGSRLVSSVREAIYIASEAGVPLHISHFKAMGSDSWPLLEKAIELIEKSRAAGLDITCDCYPYTGGATTMTALLPPWVMEGGMEAAVDRLRDKKQKQIIKDELIKPAKEWDNVLPGIGWHNIIITDAAGARWKTLAGKAVAEIADIIGEEPIDAFLDCLSESGCDVSCIHFSMREQDVMRIIRLPYVYVASDSVYVPKNAMHPRVCGSFAKVLKWAMRENRMPLSEIVKKTASMPAMRFRLKGHGIIADGANADITIISDQIYDKATYIDPQAKPQGVVAVYLNGEQVIDNGNYCAARPLGKLLRSSL